MGNNFFFYLLKNIAFFFVVLMFLYIIKVYSSFITLLNKYKGLFG